MHNIAKQLASDEPTDDVGGRILDAALEQFLHFGLRRSTVEDVARRANLSRITIYRRFPNKQDLVMAVMMREGRRSIEQMEAAVRRFPTPEEKFVESFVVGMRLMRTSPLLKRLLVTEPETIIPFLTTDAGPIMGLVRAPLAARFREAQAEGTARKFDPDEVAELILRISVSFLLTPDGVFRLDNDRRARAFAKQYLMPGVFTRRVK